MSGRLRGLTFVFLMVCSSSGCNSSSQNSDKDLRQDVSDLKKEIAEIKQEQLKTSLDATIVNLERSAVLHPGDGGFSTIRFDLGVLTVQLSDVRQFANSSKITLRFGNPLSSAITGLKAKITWGPVDKNGVPKSDAEKSKTVAFTEVIRSGAWTIVSVVLDGTTPSDIGFVQVDDIEHSGISLLN